MDSQKPSLARLLDRVVAAADSRRDDLEAGEHVVALSS